MSNADSGIDRLRSALREHDPQRVPVQRIKIRAAVAMVVRERNSSLEVLLIHRSERRGDPWSGQMAFPGGRIEPTDQSSLHAAIRECREEIAVDLERDAVSLGEMSDSAPRGHGRRIGMVIEPHVFELRGEPALQLNDEVQDVVWVPLAFVAERANRSSLLRWRGIIPIWLPCYRYRSYLIWGVTLRILEELLELQSAR
jgi:8-oxo-dGTP pyrophosphatase MutT (NUDIX family)